MFGNRTGWVFYALATMVLCVSCRTSTAQYILHTPVPSIAIPDSVYKEAKTEAIKLGRSDLEFEIGKQLIGRIIESNRHSDAQIVHFTSPGLLRAWLRSIQIRTGRKYEEMAWELVELAAPNAVPDLEEHPDSKDFILQQRLLHSGGPAPLYRRSQEHSERAPLIAPAYTPDPLPPTRSKRRKSRAPGAPTTITIELATPSVKSSGT